MIWILPVILIGGLVFPSLGYIVFFMMIFFLVLSYFKGRFWCTNLCPRGAFLDIVLKKFSLKKKIPDIFSTTTFRWIIFFVFFIFFIYQFLISEKTFYNMGYVFVKMCILTTIISVILGIPIHHRTWCSFCPMGTLQSKIHSMKTKNKA